MTYQIVPVDGGYKVKKEKSSKYFSNKPLNYEHALGQLRALYLSENIRKVHKKYNLVKYL